VICTEIEKKKKKERDEMKKIRKRRTNQYLNFGFFFLSFILLFREGGPLILAIYSLSFFIFMTLLESLNC
jgi:high-affinity Fe2+/Pb2+ permease